jgi:tetratricopeptide (TPR) repeat protein
MGFLNSSDHSERTMQQASEYDPTLPPSNPEAIEAIERANQFERAGNYEAAIAVLSEQIELGNDTRMVCRYCRGEAMLEAGQYDRAIADFEVIMANGLRFVREALQPAAAVDMAYIFALRGEADFEAVIDRVEPNENFFIRRELLTRADLEKMYRANRRSGVRPRST